jgi:hypothetical protein
MAVSTRKTRHRNNPSTPRTYPSVSRHQIREEVTSFLPSWQDWTHLQALAALIWWYRNNKAIFLTGKTSNLCRQKRHCSMLPSHSQSCPGRWYCSRFINGLPTAALPTLLKKAKSVSPVCLYQNEKQQIRQTYRRSFRRSRSVCLICPSSVLSH